jgi:hypothetical protein
MMIWWDRHAVVIIIPTYVIHPLTSFIFIYWCEEAAYVIRDKTHPQKPHTRDPILNWIPTIAHLRDTFKKNRNEWEPATATTAYSILPHRNLHKTQITSQIISVIPIVYKVRRHSMTKHCAQDVQGRDTCLNEVSRGILGPVFSTCHRWFMLVLLLYFLYHYLIYIQTSQ